MVGISNRSAFSGPEPSAIRIFSVSPELQRNTKLLLRTQYRLSPMSSAASATTREFSDDELLTMLQEACFRYYWEGSDPHSGMARENIPGDDRIVATGASGFGIAALVVGVDHGFITREQGVERLTRIVGFLEYAQRYHGAWSHYMDGS